MLCHGMADEIAPAGDVAPVVADAPVVAAEVAAPVAEVAAVEAAPVEVAAEAAPAEPAATEEAKPAEVAPVEAKEPEAPAEVAAEVQAEAPKITYEAFTMPEGINAAPEQLEQFTGTLAEMGLTQEQGQKLMDLHGSALKAASEAMATHQQATFDDTRAEWRKDAEKRFGNRFDTVVSDANWAIKELVKDPKAQKELFGVLGYTGTGDHPALLSAFATAGKRLRERASPPSPVPSNGKPMRAADRRYAK